jgi:hypothetical protein
MEKQTGEKEQSETAATCGSKSAVDRLVRPALFDGPLPPEAWQRGDIVTRDGTDEHEIIEIDEWADLMTVRCVKEPHDPWAKIGEEERNLVRRYDFVRPGKQA